jgi:hypothetical protein|tara:strand:- start:69 stop:230 length:162 start_codon:yes stop_codon:yes gene_type:complete
MEYKTLEGRTDAGRRDTELSESDVRRMLMWSIVQVIISTVVPDGGGGGRDIVV